jgi:hypothetical protein
VTRIQLQAASRSELWLEWRGEANIIVAQISTRVLGYTMEPTAGNWIPSEVRIRGMEQRRKGANRGCASSERGAKRMEDPENVMGAGDLRLVVLAGNGRTGIKSKTGFF